MNSKHQTEGVVIGARGIASRVIARVWEDDAFAAAALDAELRRHPQLDPRDVGLATELVYGVLRTEGALADRLAGLSSKNRLLEDIEARAHLFIGAYAISFLDRIPAFAAVSEAVDGVRARAGAGAAGFANAVLRKLAVEVEAKGRPGIGDAIVASAPGWLRGALRRSIGRPGAAAYLEAGPVPPPIGLCLAPGEDREAWIDRLRVAAPSAEIEPGRVSPHAILVRGAGDVRRLPGASSAWIVQEEGAQVVALALGARAGDRVLDACAGRGNKAWLLGHAVGAMSAARPGGEPGERGESSGSNESSGLGEGLVDAADVYPAKLEKLRSSPVGARVRSTFAVDWTAGAGDVPSGYDRVLVDAPCSGTGTLRRRPEIARHREASDLGRLAELQVSITRRAAARVRDGGRLVFAVCSVLREEAEEVVEKLAAPVDPAPGMVRVALVPVPFESGVVGALAGGGTALRLLPHVHGTDGYFVASFEVRFG